MEKFIDYVFSKRSKNDLIKYNEEIKNNIKLIDDLYKKFKEADNNLEKDIEELKQKNNIDINELNKYVEYMSNTINDMFRIYYTERTHYFDFWVYLPNVNNINNINEDIRKQIDIRFLRSDYDNNSLHKIDLLDYHIQNKIIDKKEQYYCCVEISVVEFYNKNQIGIEINIDKNKLNKEQKQNIQDYLNYYKKKEEFYKITAKLRTQKIIDLLNVIYEKNKEEGKIIKDYFELRLNDINKSFEKLIKYDNKELEL